MSDLIDRQQAIMHFVKASKNYECGMFELKEVTHELWQIPSAQPKIDESVYRLWKRAYEAGQRNAQSKIIKCEECIKQDLCVWYRDGAKFCSYGEREKK